MSPQQQDPHAAVDRLFAELDPLPFPARMRALATWARTAADGDPARLRPLVDELAARGAHGRRLAVFAAAVAGDADYVEARLTDDDAAVRGHAVKAARRLPVGDAALERAMFEAPEAVRRRIPSIITAGGRGALAERLLPRVRAHWGDAEAARLLAACGPAAVERLLPELFIAVARWRPLADRHPDLVLAETARQLAELPEQARTPWWVRNAEIFDVTAEARPLRVLEILEEHAPAHLPGPVRAQLGFLLKAAPGRTIRLITAPHRRVPPPSALLSRTALRRLARTDPPELADLARAWGHTPSSLAALLRALPPSRRGACYDAATAGRAARPEPALLDVLPRTRAQAEARVLAAQERERGAPWVAVLAATAHLPVEEARPELRAAVRRPAAEDRALAYPLLVRNAARSRATDAVTDLLGDLQRLRNEQDPVRSAALAALAETPAWLFSDDHAPLLDSITVAAIEARDSSGRTRAALSALAPAVLREHADSGRRTLLDWALATLGRLSGHTGGADLGRLDTSLRRGQESAVFEALRPMLEAAADKVDHGLTFALARSLGRRARRMPQLQELLWQAVQFGSASTVRQAVDLWLDDPATRAERAAAVLDLDRSAAVLPPVLGVITRVRTDLLDTVLGDTPPYGRFLAAGARWLPPLDGAARWLPRQHAAAARLYTRAAGDASLPKGVRAAHIRAAAAIPDAGSAIVGRHLDSPDTVLAEAALAALVWTDRPADALATLLGHTGDDRARVALYAAARAARFVAPARLAPVLRAALLPEEGGPGSAAKVTSRKELVRLAGTLLPVGTAADILAEVFELPGQHRDVQAACVPAAVELLGAPTAWRLLEQAADAAPAVQGAVLRAAPYDLQADERPRYARLVGRVTHSGDTDTARAALGLLARWSPWYLDAAELLLTAAVDLDDRTSWRAAADGLTALADASDGADPLLSALGRLVESEATAPLPDAEEQRDRPARRRIGHIVARLATNAVMGARPAPRVAARRAADLLAAAPDFLPEAAHLHANALDLDAEPESLHAALRRLGTLHAGRPVLASRTADTLRSRLGTARRPGDPGVLLEVAGRLTAGGDPACGLFALALTRALGERTHWSEEWRARLRDLRGHPDAEVRYAALAQATAVE
ncbi:hypothetical protein [Murinocardiopsis flavida]|nr:hypothetical protein [Murinocardiopsis flavida]